MTWITEPGFVPPEWEQTQIESGTQERKCDQCNRPKPPRSHHCRRCKTCILKMDHHCPWTNSCVGYYNYKYYLLILIHGTIGMCFVLITSVRSVYNNVFYEAKWNWLVLIAFVVAAGLQLSVLNLAIVHGFLVSKNLTIIEWADMQRNQVTFNPFDKGLFSNFTQVFGDNPLYWLIPTRNGISGNGLSFPVKFSRSIPQQL